ncbi:MAG: hypothetical protein WC602_04075 [archaeon]
MPQFPKETLAKNAKGKEEARVLAERGKYVLYSYAEPESGKEADAGKRSLILESQSGKREHYFIIPIQGGRNLLLKEKNLGEGKKKIWNPGSGKAESEFE